MASLTNDSFHQRKYVEKSCFAFCCIFFQLACSRNFVTATCWIILPTDARKIATKASRGARTCDRKMMESRAIFDFIIIGKCLWTRKLRKAEHKNVSLICFVYYFSKLQLKLLCNYDLGFASPSAQLNAIFGNHATWERKKIKVKN